MAAEARFAYHRVSAWIVLGDVEIPIVSGQIDYELNGIPRAVFRLPVGRDMRNNATSLLHTIAADMTEEIPVQLWVNMSPNSRSDATVRLLNIPDGDFRLFDGYTAGGGYSRDQHGSVQYVITCNHWLSRLSHGTAFSESSHPGNPTRYNYSALMGTGAVGDTDGLNWTTITEASRFVNQSNLAIDVWGSALLPWMRNLASKDGMWIGEVGLKGATGSGAAAAALARMGPDVACHVPSKFRDSLSIDIDVATEIANSVASRTHDPGFVTHQTLWDILVGRFCPDYLLAVVPRVDDAMVVPYIPGNRGTGRNEAAGTNGAFVLLEAAEYGTIQLEAASRRPLRGYGILSSLTTRGGALGYADDTPPSELMGLGGWYGVDKDGAVIISQGPQWLGAVLSPSRYSDAATGAGLSPIGTATMPGIGIANGSRAAGVARASTSIKPLLDAYAQARYAQEILQGRQAVVSGRFRLDVSPGSLVEIEGASEAFIADHDQLGLSYFGEVLRVSLTIDAEGRRMGTAFHIGFARTIAENASDNTSVASHPLYQSTFQGCSLR